MKHIMTNMIHKHLKTNQFFLAEENALIRMLEWTGNTQRQDSKRFFPLLGICCDLGILLYILESAFIPEKKKKKKKKMRENFSGGCGC